jgi:hypothetical protein
MRLPGDALLGGVGHPRAKVQAIWLTLDVITLPDRRGIYPKHMPTSRVAAPDAVRSPAEKSMTSRCDRCRAVEPLGNWEAMHQVPHM